MLDSSEEYIPVACGIVLLFPVVSIFASIFRNICRKFTGKQNKFLVASSPNPLLYISPLHDGGAFKRVVDREWAEIEAGRKEAGISVERRLLGVCFSGGGIRAASYMSGVMEFMEQTGCLPWVDYLSSVSGGGYLASGFMTRSTTDPHPVRNILRRLHRRTNYLFGSSKALIDCFFSVIAAMAKNIILILCSSALIGDCVKFTFEYVYAENWLNAARQTLLLHPAEEAPVSVDMLNCHDKSNHYILLNSTAGTICSQRLLNIVHIQSIFTEYILIGIVLASLLWVLIYGMYEAYMTEFHPGAVRAKISDGPITSVPVRHPTFVPQRFKDRGMTGYSSFHGSFMGIPTSEEFNEKSGIGKRYSCSENDITRELRSVSPTLPPNKNYLHPPLTKTVSSFSMHSSFADDADAEDDVEEDDEQDPAFMKVSKSAKLRNLINNTLISYMIHCILLVTLFLLFLLLVFTVLRFLVRLHKMQSADNPVPPKSILLLIEVSLSIIFASGRMFATGGGTAGFMGQFFMSSVGISAVTAVLLLVARMLAWTIFGCPFYVLESVDPGEETCVTPMPRAFIYSSVVVLLAFEVLIGEPLAQSIHDFYRRRLLKTFFRGSKDVKFCEIPSRPYFLCNVTVRNIQRSSLGTRTVQPMFLSKLFCGGDAIGYRSSWELGVHLSKGMALSGAALSINSRNILTKFTMMILGIDLGEWFSFRQCSGLRRKTIQMLCSAPFMLILFGNYKVEYKEQAYLVSMLCLCCPMLLMFVWGIILQVMGWNNSNFFLYIPFYRRAYQLFGFLGCRNDPYFYLTDGGDFDNLGLYQCLKRGMHDIVIFDAGHDDTYQFRELFETIMHAEQDLGIRFEFEVKECQSNACSDQGASDDESPPPDYRTIKLNAMQNNKKVIETIFNTSNLKKSDNCFISFTALYPRVDSNHPPRRGKIWYCKSTLTGDEPEWVKLFALSNSEFPHHSTNNQAFGLPEFEAYRRLGKFAADRTFSDYGRSLRT